MVSFGVMTISTFQSVSVIGTCPASSNCGCRDNATVHSLSTCSYREVSDIFTKEGSRSFARSDVG